MGFRSIEGNGLTFSHRSDVFRENEGFSEISVGFTSSRTVFTLKNCISFTKAYLMVHEVCLISNAERWIHANVLTVTS